MADLDVGGVGYPTDVDLLPPAGHRSPAPIPSEPKMEGSRSEGPDRAPNVKPRPQQQSPAPFGQAPPPPNNDPAPSSKAPPPNKDTPPNKAPPPTKDRKGRASNKGHAPNKGGHAPNKGGPAPKKDRPSKKSRTASRPRRSRSAGSERRGRSPEENEGGGAVSGGNRRRGNQSEDDLDDTECPVCFCRYDNAFKTPKLLACGHTFCLECLARINVASAAPAALRCPVCRAATPLARGRDLPRLPTNRALAPAITATGGRRSVRFKRSRGRLELKGRPPGTRDAEEGVVGDAEATPPTPAVLDVGRPPARGRGRLRRLLGSDRCYYAVVASVVAVTAALMLVGVLAFIIIPFRAGTLRPPPPPPPGNQTTTRPT
ncbi:LOW QUALITY PROTEIN: uncharacterized protein ACNS7B_019461 [Menidia menidia]